MNKQKLIVILILLPVVCSLFFSVGSVGAYDLELDDYAHYKVIAYEAGVGAGVDYQVVVVVHYGTGTDGTMSLNGETVALLHVGDIQADFDDVRFANQFGEVLTYKRCSYTSAVNATFVVKVEANLDVDQLVYVYFGNLAAVDASSDNALVDVISGVVGAWNMEELLATDPVLDYSGNSNDGTPTNTTVVNGPFTGKKARQFAGVDFIDFGNGAALDLTDGLTAVAYVTATDTGLAAICSRGYGGNGDYFLGFNNALKIYGFVEGQELGTPGAALGVGFKWVAQQYKTGADNLIRYYNGVEDSHYTAVGDCAGASARNLLVGKDPQDNNYFLTGTIAGFYLFSSITAADLVSLVGNYPDATLEAGKVHVRKWATTTLPAVAGVSDVVDNVAFSPVVDGALTDTEWFISGLLLVLALANVVLLAFPFALLRFVFGVLSFALSAWAFTYSGLPLAPYLQVMGLVVSVVCMFLATRARE